MVSNSHIGPRRFASYSTEWAYRSRAFWSRKPSGKLLIFVHGFAGNALLTWEQFMGLLAPQHPGWDLIFYGYDSRNQVGTNAAILVDFLTTLLESPTIPINMNLSPLRLERPSSFSFDQIVVVAHSLGAVISRRALIDAAQASWISKVRLVLFAPAHKGALSLGLALEGLTSISFGSLFGSGVRFFLPALLGLQQNSPTLTDLERDCKVLIDQGAKEPFIATQVVIAEKDKVVINDRFCADPTAKPFYGKNHRSVCKPDTEWQKPVDILIEVLNDK